jgi:tetratricopeptide (TPR) repeat protein
MAAMTRAAEEAYREGMFKQSIDLAELYSDIPYTDAAYSIHSIKAHSYFKLERYQDAEIAYQSLLQHYKPDRKTRTQINDNLAFSIYNQAIIAKSKNNSAEALRHYVRMSEAAPASDIAATGLYEAITLTFDNKQWGEAVKHIGKFQKLYPSHKLGNDVSKKLSVAYLNTNQDVAAASELIKISRTDQNIDYKIAALWKAAGLYESRKDYHAAIKAYEEYAATYQRPYPEYMESMHRLTELYGLVQNEPRASQWRNTILDADKRTPGDLKTDRTNYISSMAALHLARWMNKQYSSIKLVLPLNRSLGHKKDALQKALNLYGRAASYGIPDSTTEATYAIADIYHSFSKSLFDSERPRNLNAAELEQYKILLEDQAFPFEDNAIKFYEKNLSHYKQGISNDWVQKSFGQLKLLYPARYNRDVMLEPYINVLH